METEKHSHILPVLHLNGNRWPCLTLTELLINLCSGFNFGATISSIYKRSEGNILFDKSLEQVLRLVGKLTTFVVRYSETFCLYHI